jgi:DNA-binding response OmpR family regulator
MDSALIISYSKKTADSLTEMLAQASVYNITTVSNGGEARRMLIERDFDLYIVNAPLPDEFGQSLALNIAAKEISVVILLVKAELYDEISERVEDYGVITIAKPINKPLFWNALKLAIATHKRIKTFHNENTNPLESDNATGFPPNCRTFSAAYMATLPEPDMTTVLSSMEFPC